MQLNWHTKFVMQPGPEIMPRLLSVASETRTSPSYRCQGCYRSHERHCAFQFTLQGEGVFQDASGEHRVPRGYGFLCRINDPAVSYYFPADARGPWRFVYACLGGARVGEMVGALVDCYGPIYTLPLHTGIMADLLTWRRMPGRLVEHPLSENLALVNGLFAGLVAAKERQRPGAGSRLVPAARAWVLEHVRENVNATDLARALGVSREHLTRVFGDQTGMAPYAYILREKMRIACRLLKESSRSNKEIAAHLGFANPAHFTRSFKRAHGMTPTRFREVGAVPLA